MWSLLAAGVTAIGSLIGGLIQNKHNKDINKSNQQSVTDTNQSNKDIQESVNATNREIAEATNAANLQSVQETNAANERIQNSINETNAANVAATNEYNERIQNSINETNAANIAATNQANLDIATSTNEANKSISDSVNATNKAIADENLAYQRENLDYQKALQQQIFEREDTAYQRTVADMSAAGLNPLSMNGTNGAGEVVSTSPLSNNYAAQGYTAQGATMQAAQANPFQAMVAQAQAAHLSPAEQKSFQAVASKMQSFQAQMQSFDWLTQCFGAIGDGVDKALQHGIQMDTLNEAKKNNEVDRVAKLVGTGYVWDNKNQKVIAPGYTVGDKKINPLEIERLRNEYNFNSLEHDLKYGLFNTSTPWERNITGIQYLLDSNRIQSVAGSLGQEALDLFGSLQKMYNRAY